METSLIALVSFLFGSLITAIGFIFGFSNKISVMQSTLNELGNSFKSHLSTKQPVCPEHVEIQMGAARRDVMLSELKSEVGELKDRIRYIEERGK
jgi:hypothetical protein